MTVKSTIIIPTFNNCDYLRFCINSIKKNSFFSHEIIVHLNGIDINSEIYLNKAEIIYTKTDSNVGLCSGVNMASKKASTNYIIYAHDDMFFLPNWDFYLFNEVELIRHNNFYLSMTQISHSIGVKGNLQHIHFDCGSTLENFNEDKLIKNYQKFNFHDLQGSHWAPHLLHINIWNKIGGFSEEFDPGFASDPDLNMKLWKAGVRIFKSVSLSRVYHFGSLTTRKNKKISRNNGKKTFLFKWKFTVEFFTKHYLKRGDIYDGPLNIPKKNLSYFFDLLISKFKYFIALIR